jgi:CheY-like chemotaxis protein
MDLSLEGMDGLRATKEIKKSCPATEVIILTGYGFEDLKERARESPQLLQSSAFLGKHQISTDLLPVMKALAKGRSKST